MEPREIYIGCNASIETRVGKWWQQYIQTLGGGWELDLGFANCIALTWLGWSWTTLSLPYVEILTAFYHSSILVIYYYMHYYARWYDILKS